MHVYCNAHIVFTTRQTMLFEKINLFLNPRTESLNYGLCIIRETGRYQPNQSDGNDVLLSWTLGDSMSQA